MALVAACAALAASCPQLQAQSERPIIWTETWAGSSTMLFNTQIRVSVLGDNFPPERVNILPFDPSTETMTLNTLPDPLRRGQIYGLRTPETAARLVCNEYLRRYAAGQVGPDTPISIHLDHFGWGGYTFNGQSGNAYANSLLFAAGDSIGVDPREVASDTGELAPLGDASCGLPGLCRMTPWTEHGVDLSRKWMRRFVAQYERYRAMEISIGTRRVRIPVPRRLEFDFEGALQPNGFPVEFFLRSLTSDVVSDGRYSNTPLAGHAGRTLRSLYEQFLASGGQAPTGFIQLGAPVNQRWFKWYRDITLQAVSGAFKAAVIDELPAGWKTGPGACVVGNFYYSGTDGVNDPGTPPFISRTILSPDEAGNLLGNYNAWEPPLSLTMVNHLSSHAPVLYGFHPAHFYPWEIPSDGSPSIAGNVRLSRMTLDAIGHSFGGQWVDANGRCAITPYLTLGAFEGDRIRFNGGPGHPCDKVEYRHPFFRAMLALLRSKGISEMIIWQGLDHPPAGCAAGTLRWSELSQAAGEVWATKIASARASIGTVRAGGERSLWYARYDTLDVEGVDLPRTPGGQRVSEAAIDVTFDELTPGQLPGLAQGIVGAFTLNVELGAIVGGQGPVTCDVLVRDWRSGEWTPVRKNVSVDPRQTIIGIEVPTACRFLTPSGPGSVNVRVRVRSVLGADDPPVIARFDHVQLIPGGDCARGDFNADGVVSFPGDLLSYLQLYFQGDGSADLNCSGTIGPDDIFVAIGLVMSCGR